MNGLGDVAFGKDMQNCLRALFEDGFKPIWCKGRDIDQFVETAVRKGYRASPKES